VEKSIFSSRSLAPQGFSPNHPKFSEIHCAARVFSETILFAMFFHKLAKSLAAQWVWGNLGKFEAVFVQFEAVFAKFEAVFVQF
jgi:hypothetical protein